MKTDNDSVAVHTLRGHRYDMSTHKFRTPLAPFRLIGVHLKGR